MLAQPIGAHLAYKNLSDANLLVRWVCPTRILKRIKSLCGWMHTLSVSDYFLVYFQLYNALHDHCSSGTTTKVKK